MLPEQFKLRMKKLLGGEYEAFESALGEHEVKGLRVNTLKCETDKLSDSGVFSLTALPYCNEGFILENPSGVGNSPEHHSGMIYMQDPGAMSALSSIEIKQGWRVIDLCASPGGKASQAAAKIGESGFILANEYVPKRAKTVVSNFERLGIRNAMVTSLDTGEFKKHFSEYFDLAIVDAPCSGEGMFRKANDAITEWSEENIRQSAKRQREILANAAPLVKPGGYIIYSTCTYSLEENEAVVDEFLDTHPGYSLEEVRDELKSVSADGVAFDGAKTASLARCRRFYPHRSRGEGQFVALMKRNENLQSSEVIPKFCAAVKPNRTEMAVVEDFFQENLLKNPNGEIKKHGENLVLISHGCPILPKSVFSAGVLLGEIRKGVLHPAHQFFSAYGSLFKRQEHLSRDDERLRTYLMGGEIEAKNVKENGYLAIFYGTASLGGGKAVDGRIKNHYPKGLRLLK